MMDRRSVLGGLAVSTTSIRRLTDLFERAKFSQHEVDVALGFPVPATFSWQRYQGTFAHGQIDLYRGDAVGAYARVAEAWPQLRKAFQ